VTGGPLVLVVLDGWGLRDEQADNAIKLARTPAYSELIERFPHSSLTASGEAVGLPAGQMGNSEVGHTTMGSGRVIYQDLSRIDKSIADGDFFDKPPLIDAVSRARDGKHALHLVGLLSPNGVHSHQRHLYALIDLAARQKLDRVFVHALTDGRDTSPAGGVGFIGELENVMRKAGTGRVASVGGRYYGMDRDKRWERTRKAYDAITGTNPAHARVAVDYVRASYEKGVTDEFVEPATVVDADGKPVGPLSDGDSVIFFNYRSDRGRQLTRALAIDDFDGFVRTPCPKIAMTTMTQYDPTFTFPVVFPPQSFTGTFGEVISDLGLTNLRVAETEKYAHVTYFFNCGIERPYRGEDRLLVPSQKVATYDLAPEMSAEGICDTLVRDVSARSHHVIICNFANADMVGHTGKLEAAIRAVEILDGCLTRIVRAVRDAGGTLLITADHGNAEQMWDPIAKEPHTAHTSNPVPVILVNGGKGELLRDGGSLRDVTPTMLGLLGLEKPKEMTGTDLRML
jgi:2,3-bisphosphoglycerate-independent phosphoglycerate mutase